MFRNTYGSNQITQMITAIGQECPGDDDVAIGSVDYCNMVRRLVLCIVSRLAMGERAMCRPWINKDANFGP